MSSSDHHHYIQQLYKFSWILEYLIMEHASTLLIRQARVLLPDGTFMTGDVQIRGKETVQVASAITPSQEDGIDKEIDARGLTLLPGVINPQVHFREPGLEYKEDRATASRTCARSGITSSL